MKKAIFFLKRKASMTHGEFRQHYETSHVALAHKYLGRVMADYRRSYIQSATGIPTDEGNGNAPFTEYDCITEIWFRTDADFEEWMRIVQDPVIGAIFVADEHNFLDREAFVMTICEEVVSESSQLLPAG